MNTRTVTVEVFTAKKCPYCEKAMNMVKAMSKKYRELVWKQTSVDQFEGRREALNYGIPAVPEIVIEGRLVFIGLPTIKEFEEEIVKKI